VFGGQLSSFVSYDQHLLGAAEALPTPINRSGPDRRLPTHQLLTSLSITDSFQHHHRRQTTLIPNLRHLQRHRNTGDSRFANPALPPRQLPLPSIRRSPHLIFTVTNTGQLDYDNTYTTDLTGKNTTTLVIRM
jgi:hypothetical protein